MTEYVNINTGTVHDEKELRQIFRKQYDGDDPTNIITFTEWLNGLHYETDKHGRPFKCIYRRYTHE